MMKKLVLLLLVFASFGAHLNAQNVNIPDANFKNLLLADTAINTNQDTAIQVSEAAAYAGALNVSGGNIADLTGIAAFVLLTELDCSYNQLTGLNVSNNTALTSLICPSNQLTALDISSNPALKVLDCSGNQLTSLNTISNTLLETMICNSNQIQTLNLTFNTALKKLICSANQLLDLITNSNPLLDTINCSFNQITSLDFSGNPALLNLQVHDNLLLSMDMGAIANIEELVCYNNQLGSLDLGNCVALRSIQCNDNKFKALNLSNSPALVSFWAYNNELRYLNVQNGNNLNFIDFDTQANPDLTCIMVDSAAYSTANWLFIDPASYFSTFCTTVGIESLGEQATLNLYPNPAQVELTLSLEGNFLPVRYSIITITGKEIVNRAWTSNTINIDALTRGVYLLRMLSEDGRFLNARFVKN